MRDPFDVPLVDEEFLLEVQLMANLIIAANETDTRLPQAEIDRVLEVAPGGPAARHPDS